MQSYRLFQHVCFSICSPEKVRSERRPCSAEDVDNLDRKSSSRDACDRSNPWSPRTLPRKNTLAMQTQNTERRKEAFLELLKQKYPHHASAIAGHQERLRDHVSSHTQGLYFLPPLGFAVWWLFRSLSSSDLYCIIGWR